MISSSAENTASIFFMFVPAAEMRLEDYTVPHRWENVKIKRLAKPATTPNYTSKLTGSWRSHGNKINCLSLPSQTWRIGKWLSNYIMGRSQWPRGQRRRSAAERLRGSWVRIPPGAWVFVSCGWVLSGRGLCDGPIPRPEESYSLRCVPECDQVKINNLDTYCE
jgi:hypothetical protein